MIFFIEVSPVAAQNYKERFSIWCVGSKVKSFGAWWFGVYEMYAYFLSGWVQNLSFSNKKCTLAIFVMYCTVSIILFIIIKFC